MPVLNNTRLNPERGLTLVELLITLAIIGVLAVLLMPMADKALEWSRRAGCVSNLREIGVAFRLLLNENGGAFPAYASDPEAPGVWYDKLRPYLGVDTTKGIDITRPKVFKCPSNRTHEWNAHKLSYAYNIYLGNNDGAAAPTHPNVRVRSASIVHPSGVILCADGDSRESTYNSYLDYKWRAPGVIHNEGANILYVDGHVAWRPRAEVTADAWTEKLMWIYGAFGRYAYE